MELVYNLWTYVVLPFLISFFSAWVFWLLTFKYSNINIIFSDKLEKRKRDRNDGGQDFLYRVRLSNAGRRDLMEVSLCAKVTLKMADGKTYATHFPVGDECVNPVISRKKSDREVKKDKDYDSKTNIPRNYKVRFYGLYINDVAYKEFSKEDYKSDIRDKAKAKTLVIDDIFEAYPDARMVIYVFGNDSVTGARRKYESKEYQRKDIVEGEFRPIYKKIEDHKELRKARGKKKIQLLKEILSAIEDEQAELN